MQYRIRMILCGLIATLALSTAFALPPGFESEAEWRGFREALREKDKQYDSDEQMIERPFSSPGYHTTLTGGTVHPTRDSLEYAVGLLDSHEPERAKRAMAILRRVIALQDQDPESRTYGIWSWFEEEPLEKMSPPDWNWADFNGTQLLQVAIDHMDRLPEDLQDEVEASILHAARSIRRRNVGPGYTNIALMGTYVTLVAGERFGWPELVEYGRERLKRFYDHTMRTGSFNEYNSPTYTTVAIREITRMMQHVEDEPSRALIEKLNRFAWNHVARHFHPPTGQWAGPHSRCYRTMIDNDRLAFIQRATGDRVKFVTPDDAYDSLTAHRLRAGCPDDLVDRFVSLPEPRQERETFNRRDNRPDIIGTTWLDRLFNLGSVNVGDFWNQRRPLLAYWKHANGVGALRARVLHDAYDYASASFFSVQEQGDVLAGVTFATDRGDRHISLDRIREGAISAEDLRLRILLEGDIGDVKLPETFQIDRAARIELGEVVCDIKAPYAVFRNLPVSAEAGSDGEIAWLDLILYHGPRTTLNFNEIERAAVLLAISMKPRGEAFESAEETFADFEIVMEDGRAAAVWPRGDAADMRVEVPLEPGRTSEVQLEAAGRIGGEDAWN